jgi:hypothetical protein
VLDLGGRHLAGPNSTRACGASRASWRAERLPSVPCSSALEVVQHEHLAAAPELALTARPAARKPVSSRTDARLEPSWSPGGAAVASVADRRGCRAADACSVLRDGRRRSSVCTDVDVLAAGA